MNEFPAGALGDVQQQQRAFEILRLLDDQPVSIIVSVLEQARFLALACSRLDCASTDFAEAERGFANARER